jgi:hypothetical protein
MGKTEKLKKYEQVLMITLHAIEHGRKVSFTNLRREYRINKNFFTSLSKLRIIENIGEPHNPHYILLKKYSPELALQVLITSKELSLNKKKDLIQNFTFHSIESEKPQLEKKLNLFQKIIKTLFNGSI